MDVLDHELKELMEGMDDFILPGNLMDCFEYFRRQGMRDAGAAFNENEVSWFLDMMNRLRGVRDRKDTLDLIFDPMMYTVEHQAWEAPPGRSIELPPLNTAVFELSGRDSEFRRLAEEEVARLDELAESYPDDAVIGLAKIGAAAYGDGTAAVETRRDAIRYLAINASAKLEDYWATDDSLWEQAGSRTVPLPDVAAAIKQEVVTQAPEHTLNEAYLVCYSEEAIKTFAFDPEKYLSSERAKHLPLCGYCQVRLKSWVETLREIEENHLRQGAGSLPQA